MNFFLYFSYLFNVNESWTITLDMRYSQEKRSFKQAFVNFYLSQFFSLLRDPRFIYSLLGLLLLSSYFSSDLFPRYPSYIFSAIPISLAFLDHIQIIIAKT